MPEEQKITTIDELGKEMREGFSRLDKRLDGVDKRSDGVDARLDGMDKKIEDGFEEIAVMVKEGFNDVTSSIREMLKRLDVLEREIAAIKQRLDIIEEKLDAIERLSLIDHRRRIEYLEAEVRHLKEIVSSR
jgi:chromosome segregation ATPase